MVKIQFLKSQIPVRKIINRFKMWDLVFGIFPSIFVKIKYQILKDTAKHQGLRNQLVSVLEQKGITDKSVLDAIKKVPRHLFLDSSFGAYAYQDTAFPIGAGQTISQPYTVAFQSQLLEVKKEHKILEIGTGSGYQTAVLCMMGAKVFSVERQNELFKSTSLLFPKLNIRPKYLSFGDGYKGLPSYAPFDSIIVTAGAPFIPQPLMSQLKIGGRLVIPLGEEVQIMTLLIRKNETQFEKHEFGEFRFVPLLEDKN
ncbi:protein-L-isoaspartate(D-aspartate) O-methyltransferase [Flavobacterium xanthum]|uniref:Protein-L-isoaspartate O-methyltransferase n=1 Tax=Flavobacterium xanthum TaxID=69322 RepID=A0A1M7D663_9FLAO|nr:protein-L-isoaspartate(D-aspartate) O-methyltransferase [Flavobacterium xanthum]